MKTNVVIPLLLFGLGGHTCVVMAQSMGRFTATGNLNGPRQNHTATLLTNGKVLIVGGFGIVTGWPVWASAELYDPSTGTFAPTRDQVDVRVPSGVAPRPAVPVRLTYLARSSNEVIIGVGKP